MWSISGLNTVGSCEMPTTTWPVGLAGGLAPAAWASTRPGRTSPGGASHQASESRPRRDGRSGEKAACPRPLGSWKRLVILVSSPDLDARDRPRPRAVAKREKRNGVGIDDRIAPGHGSATRRPAPGPMPKPCPEKPVATKKPGTLSTGEMTGTASGVVDQPWCCTPAPARTPGRPRPGSPGPRR